MSLGNWLLLRVFKSLRVFACPKVTTRTSSLKTISISFLPSETKFPKFALLYTEGFWNETKLDWFAAFPATMTLGWKLDSVPRKTGKAPVQCLASASQPRSSVDTCQIVNLSPRRVQQHMPRGSGNTKERTHLPCTLLGLTAGFLLEHVYFVPKHLNHLSSGSLHILYGNTWILCLVSCNMLDYSV